MEKNITRTSKDLPAKVKDSSTTVKGGLNAVKVTKEDPSVNQVSTSEQQLPPVPTSSITFLHDWKRLRAHVDLKSNYFQVLIEQYLIIYRISS